MKEQTLDRAYSRYSNDPTEENLALIMQAGRGLVTHLTRLVSHKHVSEDLSQAGMEGLLKAVHRFDPGKNTKFSTYAYHCILGQIRSEVRKERTFDRPHWAVQIQDQVLQYSERVFKQRGTMPPKEEIALQLNLSTKGLDEALLAGSVPLDQLQTDQIRSTRMRSFELPIEDRIVLTTALSTIGDLHRRILQRMFYHGQTQEEIATDLHISRSKVQRLKQEALSEMRLLLT